MRYPCPIAMFPRTSTLGTDQSATPAAYDPIGMPGIAMPTSGADPSMHMDIQSHVAYVTRTLHKQARMGEIMFLRPPIVEGEKMSDLGVQMAEALKQRKTVSDLQDHVELWGLPELNGFLRQLEVEDVKMLYAYLHEAITPVGFLGTNSASMQKIEPRGRQTPTHPVSILTGPRMPWALNIWGRSTPGEVRLQLHRICVSKAYDGEEVYLTFKKWLEQCSGLECNPKDEFINQYMLLPVLYGNYAVENSAILTSEMVSKKYHMYAEALPFAYRVGSIQMPPSKSQNIRGAYSEKSATLHTPGFSDYDRRLAAACCALGFARREVVACPLVTLHVYRDFVVTNPSSLSAAWVCRQLGYEGWRGGEGEEEEEEEEEGGGAADY